MVRWGSQGLGLDGSRGQREAGMGLDGSRGQMRDLGWDQIGARARWEELGGQTGAGTR